jgi:hypothetical protein
MLVSVPVLAISIAHAAMWMRIASSMYVTGEEQISALLQ